jgi:ABC-type nitrate/sulfonate/bicarbonate transport system substrate-binding protein
VSLKHFEAGAVAARLFCTGIVLALNVCLVAGPATGQEPAPLRVKVFPGAQNLPLYVGVEKGVFAKHGLKVEPLFTASSTELRDGLAKGDFHVAHAAVDNSVAMVELARQDVIIVMGGDSSMNEFFVQPEIRSIADLKGRTLIVDAPNTAYALQAKKILLLHGLKEGQDYTVKPIGGTMLRAKAMQENKDYAASILNAPFSIQIARQGMKSMGRVVDLLGPYQATGAFVMRGWAKANQDALERYIAAYIESTRWALTPANRAESAALLAKWLKLPGDVAERTYDLLSDPRFGLAPDARLDPEGFRNVLALRAEIEGQWGGKPPSSDRYIDLSYYDRAAKMAGR